MSKALTPTMRLALRSMANARLAHRPPDVPGGTATVRALIKRGLAAQQGSYVHLTERGREEAHR
jgi:hypothetical protein